MHFRVFKNDNEVLMAYERREITLHTRIALPVRSFKHKVFPDIYMDKYLVTTAGKIIFNEIFPDSFQYINDGTSDNIEGITCENFRSTDIRTANLGNCVHIGPDTAV